MSIEAMAWALDAKCSGTDKVVLIGIASHADRHGENAWPSLATLAGYANVSTRSVQNAVANLIHLGFISCQLHAGGPRDFRGDRRPNLYTIDGMKPASPRPANDTKLATERHEAERAHDTKPASTELSFEPSMKSPRRSADTFATGSGTLRAFEIPPNIREQSKKHWRDYASSPEENQCPT